MVGYGQEAVGVWREINPYNIGLLIDDVVEEAGVLMTESVVILAPDMRGK